MLRKTLPWNVKQVCNMIEKQTLTFENPVQRPAGQWKPEDKSLLIHSILTMFIPDIYVIQIKGEKGNTYDVIDGLQRLTIISSYLADKWELTELPLVKLESTGETYNISGKKFSDLPSEVQEEIKGFTISFKAIELEDNDDEENIVEDIFYRLNNGKAVSREHLALVSAKKNVQNFVHRIITEHSLYTTVSHFPESSVKKSDREMSVLQSIVLISKLPYASFASKDIESFFVENTITDETLTATEQALNAIAETFKNEHNKFVTKINISAMAYMFSQAEDKEQATKFLLKYIEYITNAKSNEKKSDSYKKHTGAGCTKRDTVLKRIKAMLDLCGVNETLASEVKKQEQEQDSFAQVEDKKYDSNMQNFIDNLQEVI